MEQWEVLTTHAQTHTLPDALVFFPIHSSSETIYGLIKELRTGLCSSAVLIMGSLLGMCMCVC